MLNDEKMTHITIAKTITHIVVRLLDYCGVEGFIVALSLKFPATENCWYHNILDDS
jgi:hypothetical protein